MCRVEQTGVWWGVDEFQDYSVQQRVGRVLGEGVWWVDRDVEVSFYTTHAIQD